MDDEKRKKLEEAGWRFADTPEEMWDEMGCTTGDLWIALVAFLAIAIPVVIGIIIWFT